jgi:plastocyanin
MQESRRQFLAAAAAGVTGLLAGCGDTDSDTAAGTATPTATAGTTRTATESGGETETDTVEELFEPPEETETATVEGPSEPPGPPTDTPDGPTQTVTVAPGGEYRFDPASFAVSVGDTVRWEWGSGGHNVKPESVPDGSDWTGTAGSGTFGSDHSYGYTFDTAGEYSYYCSPHRSLEMVGSFTVRER